VATNAGTCKQCNEIQALERFEDLVSIRGRKMEKLIPIEEIDEEW
jgi:hypothetical protein